MQVHEHGERAFDTAVRVLRKVSKQAVDITLHKHV